MTGRVKCVGLTLLPLFGNQPSMFITSELIKVAFEE